jgi:O-antigen/teichoic acid export membrane protein
MSLRRAVYRGGGHLAMRQVAGMVMGAGGILLLTRLMGPAQYGLYAAALALQTLAAILACWGVGTWLVRQPGEERAQDRHRAFSFLAVAGLIALALCVAALPLVERFSRLGLGLPALVLFLATPLQVITTVPMAQLERALDFRSVARIELASQFAFFLTAVLFAAAGFGVWAPVLGFWAQHLLQAAGYFAAARYRPRWAWDPATNRAMLRFGAGYSTSIWIWQARRLVNPLIVGRYLGSEAVAWVALAIQIASQLGFVVGIAWRLSTATLARLQADAERTARALGEGMHLQALAVGPPLVAFGWLGGWLVPTVFGAEWAPVMQVYPAIALGFLTSSVFLLESSALYVRERTWDVALFHVVHIALLGGAALFLVPRWGMAGYAWSEVAALMSYATLHYFATRHVARLPFAVPAATWVVFAIALALPDRPLIGGLLIASVLFIRSTRELAAGMWRELHGHASHG